MKTFFTFGQEHAHSVNGKTFDKDCVCVIEAEDEGAARDKAFEVFGPKFCFSYPEAKWDESSMSYFPRGYINLEKSA